MEPWAIAPPTESAGAKLAELTMPLRPIKGWAQTAEAQSIASPKQTKSFLMKSLPGRFLWYTTIWGR